jgi:hypothetical protein
MIRPNHGTCSRCAASDIVSWRRRQVCENYDGGGAGAAFRVAPRRLQGLGSICWGVGLINISKDEEMSGPRKSRFAGNGSASSTNFLRQSGNSSPCSSGSRHKPSSRGFRLWAIRPADPSGDGAKSGSQVRPDDAYWPAQLRSSINGTDTTGTGTHHR